MGLLENSELPMWLAFVPPMLLLDGAGPDPHLGQGGLGGHDATARLRRPAGQARVSTCVQANEVGH